MFHVFTNSMRTSTRQPSSSAKVDTETIDLLRELGYQLLDEKNDKSKLLHETFFKCLMQSTDFWINQSIIAGVHAQSRLVNKCLLHLMYRKLSLVQHLAAVKAVFMSGNGDILEQFIGNLFAENSQTHIAHVSNDIVNNALELSLRRSAARSISLQKTSAQF